MYSYFKESRDPDSPEGGVTPYHITIMPGMVQPTPEGIIAIDLFGSKHCIVDCRLFIVPKSLQIVWCVMITSNQINITISGTVSLFVKNWTPSASNYQKRKFLTLSIEYTHHDSWIHATWSKLLHVGVEVTTCHCVFVTLEVSLQSWVFPHGWTI